MEVRPHNIHDLRPDAEVGLKLKTAVVVPVFNEPQLLERTLNSLSDQEPAQDFEVVIADDGSQEDVPAVLRRFAAMDIRYVRQEHDGFGAGRARNLGARQVSADVVVFLDQDCLVPPDFVQRHASWHTATDRRVVLGGRTNPVQGTDDEATDYRSKLRRRTANLQFGSLVFRSFISSNVSLPLWLFNETGGFDERFHRWGGEDTELGWRLWQAGARFVYDPDIVVHHQTDTDQSGGADGRERSRDLNSGLITSLIPHRHYRRSPPITIPVTPKVSVIMHSSPDGTARETWEALLRQERSDFELIVVADPDAQEPLAGARFGDPRLEFAGSLDEATDMASGEYICFVDGRGAVGMTLLSDTIRRMDERPHLVTATVGYALPADQGGSVRSRNGAADVDRAWGARMPLCWFIRTREAVKLRTAGYSTADLWSGAQEWDLNLHRTSAALRLPGATIADRPEPFSHMPPESREVLKDALSSPSNAARAVFRYGKSRLTRSPYHPVTGEARDALRPKGGERPQARYIGWTGKYNLGDEIMLSSVRGLLEWADLRTDGDPRDLLILGGGTLINRKTYLGWLLQRDSPRIERAVMGTGVASPEFWGETEDPGAWIRWLSSCCYVGVRGPYSEQTLRDWGYSGHLEISGDPGLMVQASRGTARGEGRVVVAPAWAKGELWGGSDDRVSGAIAGAVARWRAEGREVVALASSPEDDGQILEISERAGGPLLSHVSGYRDHSRGVDLIASADVVVGERLHACVIAAAVGTPFVGIEYRPKIRDFAASVGCEHLVVRSDRVEAGALLDLAESAVASGAEGVTEIVETYRSRLTAAGELVRRATTS